MAAFYDQLESTINSLTQRLVQARNVLSSSRNSIANTQADLASVPAALGPLFDDLSAAAGANPDSLAYQFLQSRAVILKDLCGAVSARADQLVKALDSVE